jgi:hypothetical protein
MGDTNIIYFDQLGFGWIVDLSVIRKLESLVLNDESITEEILFERVHTSKNMLS